MHCLEPLAVAVGLLPCLRERRGLGLRGLRSPVQLQTRPVTIYVTGFGPFMGVEETAYVVARFARQGEQ